MNKLIIILFSLIIFIAGIELGRYLQKQTYIDIQRRIDIINRGNEINRELEEIDINSLIEKRLQIIARIAECESNWRHHNLWGDNGKSYGLLQIQQRTFNYLINKAGYNNLDWKNAEHQIIILNWAIENNYGKFWSCYNKSMKQENI